MERRTSAASTAPPTGPGMHLQRDFDTNAAMVNDILAVSATKPPEEAQTASNVDA